MPHSVKSSRSAYESRTWQQCEAILQSLQIRNSPVVAKSRFPPHAAPKSKYQSLRNVNVRAGDWVVDAVRDIEEYLDIPLQERVSI